jgi:hypothetical protein
VKERCHLVYLLAPEGVDARKANELLNEYIGDRSRGLVVFHDHFIGRHGGVAVFELRSDDEEAKLADPGPLEGWQIESYPLTFSRSAVGFVAQTDFTLRAYRDVDLAQLVEDERPDKRFWWNRPG